MKPVKAMLPFYRRHRRSPGARSATTAFTSNQNQAVSDPPIDLPVGIRIAFS